jgi:SAM-dependent methyltransferase
MALAERAASAVGVDVTDAFLARARATAVERGLHTVSFVQADVESLPFDDETFDVATCKFALHHFARPERVIAEMRRVTRPGGRLVLVDMLAAEDPAKAEMHNRIERLCDPSHARALAESELDAIVAATGLEVAAKRTGQATERFAPWIEHGGPPPEAVAEIERLLRASIAVDRTGLAVREENGELVFDHRGATYLLTRP